MGAVEHHSRHLRLLPHQRHGGEDPHAGERPLYPPVCDRGPVGRPHPAHDIYTMEKTLNLNTDQGQMPTAQGSFHPDIGKCDSLAQMTAHS